MLPISENFRHTSPYGTIEGKEEYISLIEANKDKFLGHNFIIREEIYDKACVRYTAQKEKFSLDVSEWYHIVDCQIDQIIAYYNIEGNISKERELTIPQ